MRLPALIVAMISALPACYGQPSQTFVLKPTQMARFHLSREAAQPHTVVIYNETTQVTIVHETNPTGERISQVNTGITDQTIRVTVHGCHAGRVVGAGNAFTFQFEDAGDGDFNDTQVHVSILSIDDPAHALRVAALLMKINATDSEQTSAHKGRRERKQKSRRNLEVAAPAAASPAPTSYALSSQTQTAYNNLMRDVEDFQRLTSALITFSVWQKLLEPTIETSYTIATEDWSAYTRAISNLAQIAHQRICNDAILYATIDDTVSRTADDRRFWESIARAHCSR